MSEQRSIQTIFRSATKGDEFTIASNILLQDPKIHQSTRGFVAMLLSHPLNWEIEVKRIVKTYKEGKHAVYTMINEAIEFGYMGRFTIRNERGHVTKHVYWVTDDPEAAPVEVEYGEIIDEITGPYAREQSKKTPLTDNQEVGPSQPLSENQEVGPTSQKSTSRKSGNGPLYNKINTTAAAAKYEFAKKAIDAYREIQAECNFRECLEATPSRLEAIVGCLVVLGGGHESNLEAGLSRWLDLLERASTSPWHRGECKPGKGFSQAYRLSIDDMAKPQILEKLSEAPLKFGPKDPRWKVWADWSKQHEPDRYRIMNKIENDEIKTERWEFPSAEPPLTQATV